MGKCRYCGESAGLFRRQHKACAQRNDRAASAIKELCVNAALHGDDLESLHDRVRAVATEADMNVADDYFPHVLAVGWCEAVDEAMQDHALSNVEKRRLNRYRERFDLGETILNRQGFFDLFKMMSLLNALSRGILPRPDLDLFNARFGRLPFNLMKSEALLWVFGDVGYGEQITHREYQGSSMGMSIRIASGVYVRPGSFRGRTVETISMEHTDDGLFGITTKHIYFKGQNKAFRVRLEKIVSLDPYQDGLGIMRDTARAKPELFYMDETSVWFAVNLMEAVQALEDGVKLRASSPMLDEIVDEIPEDADDEGGLFVAGVGISP
jgi:hypothetical protein